MDKRLRIAGIAAALAFSIIILTSPSDPLPLPEPTTTQSGSDSVEVLATNLKKPRSMTFGDDRIFLTEKDGRIRVVQDGALLENPLATLRTADVFDGGLLGIASHPDFSNNHFLYVYYTYASEGVLWNKVLRITEKDNRLEDAMTILDKIPGSQFSNGGVVKFGPDGKLYVGTGSVSDSSHIAQDPSSLAGKILRLNDDGTIPGDNPFADSAVYTLGHRNLQGFAWDKNGAMYSSELGPAKNDEINLIIPGENYGWPDQECSGSPDFVDASICFDPAIEPGGIIIYSHDRLALQDKLVLSTLRATNLYKFDLMGGQIDMEESVLGGLGRIRDVGQGPDGFLYIITSNTDGKGFPDGTDDKLVRIVR